MKAVIYVRVSSEKQIDGYSLDSQADLCSQKATQLGYEVVRIFREEGVSATTTNRPELQEMLRFCKDQRNGITAVIVYSLSRLNRNTLDYLQVRSELASRGVSLLSVTEPSGDKPADKMIETILASFHQYQNEERAQNVANSLKRRFQEGNITVKPPLGYKMVKVNGKSRAEKDPETFYMLQKMWRRIEKERLSCREVATELNRLGVKSTYSRRSKKIRPQSVSSIFSNKFYMGILVSDKYGEAKGLHEPMVSEETFYKVREIMTGKKPLKGMYARQREDFPLRGILKCSHCQRKLSSSWSQGKKKKYPYYSCYSRGVHQSVSYKKSEIEKQYSILLKQVKFKKAFMEYVREVVKEVYLNKYDLILQSEDQIHKDIAEIDETLKKLSLKHLQGIYTDEEYLALKDELNVQKIDKKGLLSEKKIERLDIDTILEFIVFYYTNLDRVWFDATLEGKLKIACSLFPSGIEVDKTGLRTPQLGRAYNLTKQMRKSGEPDLNYFEHLWCEYSVQFAELQEYISVDL